jgi:hypothetical protein
MNVNNKKRAIILSSLLWGLISPFLFLLLLRADKPLNAFEVVLKAIFYISCYISGQTVFFIGELLKIGDANPLIVIVAVFFFGIFQIIIYLLLGWIIAMLVYPNKKALTEPATPQE